MSSNKYQAEVILEVDKEIATATNNDEDYWVRMVAFCSLQVLLREDRVGW